MNVKKLFEEQRKLDEHIILKKGLQGQDLTRNTILALMVEIGELANETRCFKYWSEKPASDKPVILDEFADCMHFVLSLGNQIPASKKLLPEEIDFSDPDIYDVEGRATTELLIQLYDSVLTFAYFKSTDTYAQVWAWLLRVGNRLDISGAEMEQAYMKKNAENHRRQETGY